MQHNKIIKKFSFYLLFLLMPAIGFAQGLPPLTHTLTALKKPVPAPALSFQNMDEEIVDLKDLKGKVVVINFWATWCPPCRREMGSLERLYQATKDKNVEVLAVNIGEDIDTVFSFMGEIEPAPTFSILFDSDAVSMKRWNVRGLPTTYVVNDKGQVVYRAVGGREFDHPDIINKVVNLHKAKPITQAYPLREIAPKVYVIEGPTESPNVKNQGFMNNPSFIVTDAGVVVIDPGSSVQIGDMLLKHIKTVTSKPIVAVFITHDHGDHWMGNDAIIAQYPKAKIYAHPKIKTNLEARDGQKWLDFMMDFTKGATAGTRIIEPTDAVKDGDVIKIGDLSFEVLSKGKAHTTTDIMILVKEKGVMYMGDIANNGFVVPIEGNISGDIKAIDDALSASATVFILGHGISSGADKVKNYRNLLNTIYTSVKQGFKDDLADYEIRPLLRPKLKSWENWTNFDAQLGAMINFTYLEIEASDF